MFDENAWTQRDIDLHDDSDTTVKTYEEMTALIKKAIEMARQTQGLPHFTPDALAAAVLVDVEFN